MVLRNSGKIKLTMVAEVSVSAQGELKVNRIVVAIDSDHVVNPDTCRAQAEGCVVFGLGAVLCQENSLKNGRIVESNFHDFPLLTMVEMLEVETLLVPTGGFWGRHGEPAMLPLAPAVRNAVSRTTGNRVRTLPLKHHDLRRASMPVVVERRRIRRIEERGERGNAQFDLVNGWMTGFHRACVGAARGPAVRASCAPSWTPPPTRSSQSTHSTGCDSR